MIPQRTLNSLNRYVEHRIMPGGFLTAVLCNDLVGAVGRADSENLAALPEIVRHVYNELPSTCWGNKEAVWSWLENRFYEKLGEQA